VSDLYRLSAGDNPIKPSDVILFCAECLKANPFARHAMAHRPTAPDPARTEPPGSLNVLVLHEYHFSSVIEIEFAIFPAHSKL
jgi:hypothetical protein